MLDEELMKLVSSRLSFVFQWATPIIVERLWTNVVTQRLLAEGVAHTKIKEVGVFDCLVGEVEHCRNDLQRD